MKCPKCEGKVRVVDSVNTQYNEVLRKRLCTVCNETFYTCECVAYPDAQFIDEWISSHRTSYIKKKERKKNEV